jgi:hypothetical protein
MEKEQWKVIEGFEGYQVSSLGRVKSSSRQVCNPKRCYISKERIRKLDLSKHGYYQVKLSNGLIRKTYPIHKLVAIAFLSHKPCGYKEIVDHIDNNPLNNTVNNLQLITQRENVSKNPRKGFSKYLGVSFHNQTGKWQSFIYIKPKNINLGLFNTEIEAHEAYKLKLKQI